MKKIILAAVLALGLGGYIFWNSRSSSSEGAGNSLADATVSSSTPTSSAGSETTNPMASGSGSGSNNTTATAGITASTGQYKDGTYKGSIANSIYGDVQIAAIIKGGKIADVTMLKYPNDRANSLEISNQSLPVLKKETIAIQSAHVDIVSGATQTSEAFQQSLSSALASAQS